MITYAGERRLPDSGLTAAWRRGLDTMLAAELHTSVEFWLYAGLVTVALLMRFTDLGARALHHDESLHAAFSYYLRTGKGYEHDPLMHGPLLFHITALIYLLFGASDATSRFAPALIGSGLVLLPLLLRPWLGRIGAFAAAAFIAFSPSLLYYSRFIRHDPFVIFFTLGLFISVFRYRATQHFGWLVAAAAALSLSFATMEITFIVAAILLVYLDGSAASDLAARIADHRGLSAPRRAAVFVGLLPVAWLAVCIWPFIESLRRRIGLEEMPSDGVLLLVLGLLTAPQFSAAIRVPLKMLHYDILAGPGYPVMGRVLTRMEAVGGLTVIALLAVTMLLGSCWHQKRWFILAAVFYIPYFLLYTTFLTNRQGWGSGIWGALSYWLNQQDVNRGAQPAFYYAITVPTYEYLVLCFGAVGLVIQAARRGLNSFVLLLFGFGLAGIVLPLVNDRYGNSASVPVVIAAIACIVAAMRGDRVRQFVVFYFVTIFFGLSVAGEKMPWLTEHLALPLALLAGLAVNDIFGGLVRLPAPRRAVYAVGLFAFALVGATIATILASKTDANVLRIGAVVMALATLVAGSAWLVRRAVVPGTHGHPRSGPAGLVLVGMVSAAAVLGLFGMLTLRNDWRMNWVHPDTPDEMLIYTQSSPDVPKLAKKIDQLALESGEGHKLKITVDANDSFTWPWAWYLRDYSNTSYPDLSVYGTNPATAANLNPGSVLLLNAADQAVASEFTGLYGPGERFHLRWWFPEDYKQTSARSFLRWVRSGSIFNTWWRYVTNRDGFTVPPSDVSPASGPGTRLPDAIVSAAAGRNKVALGSVDAVAYFPANWLPGMGLTNATAAGTGQAASTARMNGSTLTLGAPGLGAGQFRHPSGLATDASGNMYVADTLNDRVQKFDSAGNFLAQAGGPGTSQFNQPWALAVGGDGSVYVADTWNHRVVKLDSDLKQVTTWGRPVGPAGAVSPLDLYGPRSIAVDGDGNIWITDTGNARVVKYDPSGVPLGTVGGRGAGAGQFDEPVGIALAPNGEIYVADAWNNRIEWFDTSMAFKGQMRVSDWVNGSAGRDAENKPYLAVLPDGSILTTYPSADRLVEYDTQGRVTRSLDALPGMTDKLKRPLGIVVTADGKLLLSDSTSNQVVQLPVADLPQP